MFRQIVLTLSHGTSADKIKGQQISPKRRWSQRERRQIERQGERNMGGDTTIALVSVVLRWVVDGAISTEPWNWEEELPGINHGADASFYSNIKGWGDTALELSASLHHHRESPVLSSDHLRRIPRGDLIRKWETGRYWGETLWNVKRSGRHVEVVEPQQSLNLLPHLVRPKMGSIGDIEKSFGKNKLIVIILCFKCPYLTSLHLSWSSWSLRKRHIRWQGTFCPEQFAENDPIN